MKHDTHPSPRQRLFAKVASAALALLLFAAYLTPLSSAAQNPFAHKGLCDTDPLTQPCGDQGFNSCGQIYFHPYPGGITTTLSLTDTMLYTNTPEYTDTCMAPFNFSWSLHDAPLGNSSGTDVSKYPTMRADTVPHTFYITFGRQTTTWVEEDWLVLSRFPNDINIYWSGAQRTLSWDLFVDGVQSGTVEIVPGTQEWAYPGYNTYDGRPYLFVKGVWKVTYTPGSAYGLPNNVREFALRPKILYNIGGIPATSIASEEFRFKAVMVGSEAVAGTEDGEYGTFDTPLVPNMILHDPPGDGSSTSLESTEETCTGRSYSVAFDNSNDNFFNVRLGYSGSVGVAVEVDLDIWAQFGTTSTAGISTTEAGGYQSCFSLGTTIETPEEGLPDDQFFASSIRYQYGWVKTVARSGCSAPLDTAQFVAKPIQRLASQKYSESFLRGVLVPALQVQVATLVQGTPAWQGASDQLEVWEQALALNDSIKANAEFVTEENIQAPSSTGYTLTTTTETSRSIDCNVYLERGLNFEAGFSIAGNGLSGGYGVRFRQEFGKGSSTSSAQTNTLAYTLADGSEGDYFNVEVRKDPVFGHPVFNTIPGTAPLNTQTSCPYEGGYQREQPQLWVGQSGSSTMVLNEVPIGGVASFPLLLCNNSDEERSYFLAPIDQTAQAPVNLAVATETNLTQANPIQFTIPANSCLPLQTLGLTQNGLANLDYNGLVLQLYSDCEPEIKSSVTISANFGVGNTADYCEPASTSGTSGGDWIDGVQIGSINNTGTGGITGPAYTNYAAQYSTPLSRNALTTLSVTSGANSDDRYAAWIDYDRDGTFETDEKLGEVTTTAVFQVQSFSFTVPNTALLGSTVLRVRGANSPNPGLDPCFPYTSGETEDYAVVINSNTPQDCAGVNNGPALPGTACSDGNANTGNDTWNANCTCAGQVIDCAGVPGGTTTSGSPCDDGNANTDGDVYDANCQCAGLALDCLGVPGGTTVQGTACDDGDAATGNDVYNASCQCAGQLIDCLGVSGGTTTVGTPCDDGNPLSSGDAYAANCECAGEVTDCEGTAGGPVLPGSPCDDGLACTANDVRGTDCACSGTTITIGAVTGATTVTGNTSNAFVISPIANATSYTWELPNGWSTSDNGAFVLLAEANNTAGPVQLCVTVMVGDCELTSCITVTVDFNTGIATNEANDGDWFTVQPNPTNGTFQLRPSTTDPTPLRISIRNGLGQEVLAPFTVAGQRAIDMDLSDVAAGAYYLLATRNGEQQVIKIMVQR